MASREIKDLSIYMQDMCQKHLALCANNQVLQDKGVEVIITCTYRSFTEQEQLYEQGRTMPGPIVTNARGGQSKHNVYANGRAAEAYDLCPIEKGKCAWGDSSAWKIIGELGQSLGLKWYGAPDAPFKEMPHFQNPNV